VISSVQGRGFVAVSVLPFQIQLFLIMAAIVTVYIVLGVLL